MAASMGLTTWLICVSLVAVASAEHCSANPVDFKNPVRSAAEDEVKQLPGLDWAPGFKHYSGYLEADDEKPTNRFWHYWLVESKNGEASSRPLVLWLNGGPGCSSLLGLLTELGPFRVGENNSIVENPHAWNHEANLLFLESPAGVGFSYAVNGDTKADDETTAQQNYLALKSFMRKFPHLANNPLFLTGESYAGVYLPTLAVLVDQDAEMQLKGVAIGNGLLDASKNVESLVYFSYHHGLLSKSLWSRLPESCCKGKPPARGNCKFSGWLKMPCLHWVVQAKFEVLGAGINPYNMYDKCRRRPKRDSSSEGVAEGREHFDRALLVQAFNLTEEPTKFRLDYARFEHDLTCTDNSVTTNYLNRAEVKSALHIPDGLGKFTSCSSLPYTIIYPNVPGGMAAQIRQLLRSPRKLELLVYNGDVDLMCNSIGDEWFVDDLNRRLLNDYRPWRVAGQTAGFYKHYEGIRFVTVKGSGHLVPADKPMEARHMFEQFLNSVLTGKPNAQLGG